MTRKTGSKLLILAFTVVLLAGAQTAWAGPIEAGDSIDFTNTFIVDAVTDYATNDAVAPGLSGIGDVLALKRKRWHRKSVHRTSVPEPSSLLLLGFGLAIVALPRLRSRNAL